MIKPNSELEVPFCLMTEGQANLTLLAVNQELKAEIAYRKNDTSLGNILMRMAKYLRATGENRELHNKAKLSELAYLHKGSESTLMHSIVASAMEQNKPSITLSASEEKQFFNNTFAALNGNPVDEFDPTPEQINFCRGESSEIALAEELKNGRTFSPGTFDPSTEEVHPVGTDGRLVVIKTVNLRSREQRLFEACSSRIVMENIVNKKLIEAGNLVIYRLIEDAGHDIAFNNKVNNRLVQQSAWINETAKATGLSFQNILLVLENSALNINEETPSTTLANISTIIANPDVSLPTTLPPLGTQQGGANFVVLIAKVVVEIIFAIINAIKKRRAETFTEIKDPSIIAARCIDSNIPLEDCPGLPPEFGDGNDEKNNLGAIIAGVSFAGLALLTITNKDDIEEADGKGKKKKKKKKGKGKKKLAPIE